MGSSVVDAGKYPSPGHLDILLTDRCPNECVHCCIDLPADDAIARARELDTEEWKRILREAADLGTLSIRLSGGKPLLREDFSELYLYARRLGLRVGLFTNARLITPDLADLFARIPPLQQIEVTVHGMRRESCEAVTCVPGSFDEFRRGVELLLDRHIPLMVKGALLPANKIDVPALEAWAATLPGMDRPVAYAMFFDLRTRRDAASKNRLIAKLRVPPEEGVTFLARSQLYRRDTLRYCSQFMAASGDRLFSCGAGMGGCVDPYGAFHMCMQLRHPNLAYDLRSGSLREAVADVFPPTPCHGSGLSGALLSLLPDGPMRAVPREIVVRARHVGHSGGVSLPGGPRTGPASGVADGGRACLGSQRWR